MKHTGTINRQLKAGINDEQLADLVMDLRTEDRLCIVSDGSVKEGVWQRTCGSYAFGDDVGLVR